MLSGRKQAHCLTYNYGIFRLLFAFYPILSYPILLDQFSLAESTVRAELCNCFLQLSQIALECLGGTSVKERRFLLGVCSLAICTGASSPCGFQIQVLLHRRSPLTLSLPPFPPPHLKQSILLGAGCEKFLRGFQKQV